MDLHSVVELGTLFVGGFSAFATYRQLQLMQAKVAKRSSGGSIWWHSPMVIALATLTVLNFSLWLVATWQRPQQATLSVSGWGGVGLPEGRALFLTAVAADDDPTHRMMAIAYHYVADLDVFDLRDLQKSALFDIRKGPQMMIIKPDTKFLDEANSGKHYAANYSLLVMPRSVERDEVTTLRRLAELGGKVVATMQGPP